jgi:predicted dehydrogenase/threonine dehydrogenase-like Zn-dependent dehydrogenase
MLQVQQGLRDGRTRVVRVPDPAVRPGQVVIRNVRSVISAGTERMVMELAKKSLLGKARERPDQVRRVLEKLRTEGFRQTLTQVTDRLDEPVTMGYSSAGIVLACGAGVQEFKPGDRVASNGGHAGIVAVPHHLCAAVPEGVDFDDAAFTVLAAIALQGVRLSRLTLGETAFVVGLGLVGQLTVSLLRAQGCRVIGTDPDIMRCTLAAQMGAAIARPGLNGQDVHNLTGGLGADAVLIAASTSSDEPVVTAAEAVRKRGRVVAVGAVGMHLPRRPFYFSEAEFVVSCSYGPGRYDPTYEDRGRDYPPAFVRWTEQRNLQAVLDLMANGSLDPKPLVTHRFSIDDAEQAYALLSEASARTMAIVVEYFERPAERSIALRPQRAGAPGTLGVGFIGSGQFARTVLLPVLREIQGILPRVICSAGGASAARASEKWGFETATTDVSVVLDDPAVQAVFIATRHDQHADLVARALNAGKHVFVEKPLALSAEELGLVERALIETPTTPILTVGFNRRFSPAARAVRAFFEAATIPLAVSIRFNAGAVPAEHWVQDDEEGGGRIVGEACHAIDLASFLTGSPVARVFAESIGGPHAPLVTDDQCFITLRHANGSISSIAYLSGGDRAFTKERVEVIGAGRVAVIDDFRSVTMVSGGKSRGQRWSKQDKGHRAEVAAFVKGIRTDTWSIPWAELRSTTAGALLAVRSLREGVPFDLEEPLG